MGYIEGPVGLHRHLQDQSFTEEIKTIVMSLVVISL